MPSVALQFIGSLAAVSALVWLAYRFGFSGAPEMADDDEAASYAREVAGGFDPEHVELGTARHSALLRDRAGRVVLVAPSGAHFIARLLSLRTIVRRSGGRLMVRDGSLVGEFDLGRSANDWEEAIARLD